MKGVKKLTKKPEVSEIFLEALSYQYSTIFLFVSFLIFMSFIVVLITYLFDKTEIEKLKKEMKTIKFGMLISVFLIIISLFFSWNGAKTFLENNDKFLLIESNRDWFLKNSETIYTDLKPKEYDIYKITSIEEVTRKDEYVYLDGKSVRSSGKEIVMIDYINSLDKGFLFNVNALIINKENEIEKIMFFANFKVEDKDLAEKAVLFNTNDSKKDIGENIMFGEIKINKNE